MIIPVKFEWIISTPLNDSHWFFFFSLWRMIHHLPVLNCLLLVHQSCQVHCLMFLPPQQSVSSVAECFWNIQLCCLHHCLSVDKKNTWLHTNAPWDWFNGRVVWGGGPEIHSEALKQKVMGLILMARSSTRKVFHLQLFFPSEPVYFLWECHQLCPISY